MTKLSRFFKGSAQPLINGEDKIVIIWSPKSACTSVLIWHLHRLGILKAARMYNGWPHAYRTQVLNKSQAVSNWVKTLNENDYKFIRVVRDPFKRTVSCYRHSLKYGLLDNLENTGRLKCINSEVGYSFLVFLEFIKSMSFEAIDSHFRPQYQEIESYVNFKIINVDKDNLFLELNKLEKDLSLSITNFEKIKWLEKISIRHHSGEILDHDADFDHQTSLNVFNAKNRWPRNEVFLNEETRKIIREIYTQDIFYYTDA